MFLQILVMNCSCSFFLRISLINHVSHPLAFLLKKTWTTDVYQGSDQAQSLLQFYLCNRFQRSAIDDFFNSWNEMITEVPLPFYDHYSLILIWVGSLGVRFEVVRVKLPPLPHPCLKLVRIMLETWNLVRKYTHM